MDTRRATGRFHHGKFIPIHIPLSYEVKNAVYAHAHERVNDNAFHRRRSHTKSDRALIQDAEA
jgi:hypothetical protein